jgi:DNA repair protein RecN (Recombination protein N)
VDVGIGGRSGQVVGEKLAALGRHHQVLCITHLPQVAARAGQHLAVTKRVVSPSASMPAIKGSPARTMRARRG